MPRGRPRKTPKEAKIDSEKWILDTLRREGKQTNKQLLKATGLSEPALAERLADLEKANEQGRRRGPRITHIENPQDRRSKIYEITVDGFEDLERQLLKERIDNTPLILNTQTLLLQNKRPEWYGKRKGGDDPKNAPATKTEPSHISAVFELKERSKSSWKTTVFREFWHYVHSQFLATMKSKYQTQSCKDIEVKCETMTNDFFNVLQANFNQSIFSSVKMKPLEPSKWSVMKPAILGSPIKLDFYAKVYIDLFEQYLGVLHETIKAQYADIWEFLVDSQKGRIFFVAEFDFRNIAYWINNAEMREFRTEEYNEMWRKRLESEDQSSPN